MRGPGSVVYGTDAFHGTFSLATYERGSDVRVEKYWQPPLQSDLVLTAEEALDQLEELLTEEWFVCAAGPALPPGGEHPFAGL